MFGADVVGLYPNLDTKPTCEDVFNAVLETDLEWKDVDWKLALKYLAMTLSREELSRYGILTFLIVFFSHFSSAP